jgi:putative membrane protein
MKRFWQSVVIILLVLYGLLMLYVILRPFLSLPLILLLLPFTALTLFGFSVGHALLSLGTRRTLLFVGLTFGISLLFESVGVWTGSVYGPYHYTDRFGVKIFGLVPLIIPIGRFMMIYPCHVLVERVMGNS